MNKYLLAGLFLFVLTFISCSQKIVVDKNPPDKEVQQYIFEQFMEGKAPQYFKNLMLRHSFKEHTVRYLLEEAYPECIGIYDSTGFYSASLDDASWIDSMLVSLEEERLGNEVLNFLEDDNNFIPPIIENTTEEKEQVEEETVPEETDQTNLPVPEVESVEKRLLDSYNRLKVMEYGQELFFPVQREQGDAVLIHYSNKAAVRLFYDEFFRLTKKEHWNMESVQNAKIKLVEKYEYEGQSKNPVQKIIEADDTLFVSKLNENGLVIRTLKYEVPKLTEEDSKKSDSKKQSNKLISTTTWTYDQKNRITSETVSEKSKVQKQVFIYDKIDKLGDNPDNIPPDYEYYENGVLRTKTEYKTKGTYNTTIVFDSINTVRAEYENYIKVRDVYYLNGVQRRIKSYE